MFNIRDNFLSQGSPPVRLTAMSTSHYLNPPALKFNIVAPKARKAKFKCQLNDINRELFLLIKTQKSLPESQRRRDLCI